MARGCGEKPQKPAPRSSVVEKRRANNGKPKRPSSGYRAPVTDNDPMEKDSESNYP